MLFVDAVAVVQFQPDVRLAVTDVATLDVSSLHSLVKFAHAELEIVCTLDMDAGVFKLEAQLSPTSFVLDPSCHLTGGFAIFS